MIKLCYINLHEWLNYTAENGFKIILRSIDGFHSDICRVEKIENGWKLQRSGKPALLVTHGREMELSTIYDKAAEY